MPRHGVPRGTRCRGVRGAAYTGTISVNFHDRRMFNRVHEMVLAIDHIVNQNTSHLCFSFTLEEVSC